MVVLKRKSPVRVNVVLDFVQKDKLTAFVSLLVTIESRAGKQSERKTTKQKTSKSIRTRLVGESFSFNYIYA